MTCFKRSGLFYHRNEFLFDVAPDAENEANDSKTAVIMATMEETPEVQVITEVHAHDEAHQLKRLVKKKFKMSGKLLSTQQLRLTLRKLKKKVT